MQIELIDFWNNQRRIYNKGLLFTSAIALIGSLVLSLVINFQYKDIDVAWWQTLIATAINMLVYIGLINLILIALELINRTVFTGIKPQQLKIVNQFIYWIIMIIPLLAIVVGIIAVIQQKIDFVNFL